MEGERELWERITMCWFTAESMAFSHSDSCERRLPVTQRAAGACISELSHGKHKSQRGIASSANAQLYRFAISVHLGGFLVFIFPKQTLEC